MNGMLSLGLFIITLGLILCFFYYSFVAESNEPISLKGRYLEMIVARIEPGSWNKHI
jgi:hypothetical protein